MTSNPSASVISRFLKYPARQAGRRKLFVFLLMTVLPQAFFTLMRGNFVTLSFFTTRHKSNNFCFTILMI
jgi:hypothetical protein